MENITLYSIPYYKRSVFKGSYKGMNFRIGKSGDDEHPTLEAIAWKGPYILEKTEETVWRQEFSFSDEGLKMAEEWLEDKQSTLFQ